jgi:hypothetical protein
VINEIHKEMVGMRQKWMDAAFRLCSVPTSDPILAGKAASPTITLPEWILLHSPPAFAEVAK